MERSYTGPQKGRGKDHVVFVVPALVGTAPVLPGNWGDFVNVMEEMTCAESSTLQ